MENSTHDVFSGYVLSASSALSASSEEEVASHNQLAEKLLPELRKKLAKEIQRRGLWTQSPSYLGVYGWSEWNTIELASNAMVDGPLSELTLDSFKYIFLDRLRSLRAQLEARPSIEGLVSLNLRHFLLERQRMADPLGTRIYRTLRSAVTRGREKGLLPDVGPSAQIRQDTVLIFHENGEDHHELETLSESLLSEWTAEWVPVVMPDLVTAMGPAQTSVVEFVATRLLDLNQHGKKLAFADLARVTIRTVREHWTAVMEQDFGDSSIQDEGTQVHVSQWVLPDEALEQWQSFQALQKCVVEGIEQLAGRGRTSEYLLRLWAFCHASATSRGDSNPDESVSVRPSDRSLARLLRLPRDRIPSFFETLRELVSKCRTSSFRTSTSPSSSTP